jgi:putative endonuclease
MKQPAVYMLASRRNGTLYTGVTSDLVKRIWEHRNDIVEGFTKRYGVHSLVYFELHDDMPEAIRREKQIKKWNRAWKIELIERTNPQWQDLWGSLTEGEEIDSRMRGNDSGCVVPAKAWTQELPARLDSRLRGDDRGGGT